MITNIIRVLISIFFLLCTTSITTANAFITTDNVLDKFDKSVNELIDGHARYIVYFGDESTSSLARQNHINDRLNKAIVDNVDRQKERVSARKAHILKSLTGQDFQIIQSFNAIPVMVIETSNTTITEVAKSPYVTKIGLDNGGGQGHLSEAIPQTNIDLVKAMPLSGKGVEVAIIDSGLDKDHPDFASRVASIACFSNDCNISTDDQNGHGTNVTGILAGAGIVAPQGGAPEATLHIVKMLDANNSYDSASQAIAALDYIITELPTVSIINMSFGSNTLFTTACDNDFGWTQSLSDAVNQLNARGVTLFASSGNEADDTAITAPACLSNVIAVGAVWDAGISRYSGFCNEPSPITGELTCFSNSNTQVDIVAPGALTTASGINGSISTYAGTSMASPLVASCAALLKQFSPSISPIEIRSALTGNPAAFVTDSKGRSFPSLDCWQAYLSITGFEPPDIRINSPDNNSQYFTDQIINFTASASDQNDGDIGRNIQWFYDERLVGEGENLSRAFDAGTHSVSAQIENSAGIIAQATVSVNVKTPAPPVVTPNTDSGGGALETKLLLLLLLCLILRQHNLKIRPLKE